METRSSNSTIIPSTQMHNPETAGSSSLDAPATVSSLPISPPPHAGPSNGPYEAFVSHAGEDKVTISIPLRERLRKRGITAFVDMQDMPPGTDAERAMIHAMHAARVAVVVLSPEFVARKWPMKELMHFLTRRDQNNAVGHEGLTIIPFFYRLSISELYDEPRLDRKDKHGDKLYDVSRFHERQRNGEPEANIAQIQAALRKLHGIMGIENFVNANNDTSYEMAVKRDLMLDMLCDKVCNALPKSSVENAVTEHVPETEHDTFRAHFDIAYNVSELVFDFDGKDSNGIVCTQEGKILEMLLDTSKQRNRVIAVRGIGGVGKTTLLRKIRSLNRVLERFQDGVYNMEVGRDATRSGLHKMLTSMVLKSEGKEPAANMQAETDIRKLIEVFRSWFAQRRCLFVIDDVWETKEVTRGTIHELLNLHTSGRDSKVLLTTRSMDVATGGETCVCLEPRESLESESRAILYRYAGLKPKREHVEDNRAVDDILERCAGLPLFLVVAGKSVKTLSFRRNHKGCMAYRLYAKELKTSMSDLVTAEAGSYEGLSARLKISIGVVEERQKRFEFDLSCSMAEMHRRLSVMRKQMRVPMGMLKHLWEVENESEAARIAKEFEQVGLADIEFGNEECEVVEALRLHDSIYEFAVYETKRRKEEGVWHKTLLNGYGKLLISSSGEGEWWNENLEDDKYIHRNICRHLVGAGLQDQLFVLLLSPQWVQRQVDVNGVLSAESDFSAGIDAIQSRTAKVDDKESDEMEEALQLIGEAIALSSSYILKNVREVWFQMQGRLKSIGIRNRFVREYVMWIERNSPKPRVLCMNDLLVRPGGANKRIVLVGSGVECMVALDDEERVACGCSDGSIAILNVARSEIEVRWRAHDEGVRAINVGKDGTRIVSGSWDSSAKISDARNGRCITTFDGHWSVVRFVAITHDGMRVVSSDDDTVQVWDIEYGQRVSPAINTGDMLCLAVLRDGKHIVMGGRGGALEIWNLLTNTKVGASFDGHTNGVECVAMTADESRLVTVSCDRTVRKWDLESRHQVGDSFDGDDIVSSCVSLSVDGSRAASGSHDGSIRVWDVQRGKQVCEALIGHTSWISGLSFLEDRDTIVSCSGDGSVRVWDFRKKRKEVAIDKHSGIVSSVSFTPNGKFAVSGSFDGTLRLWDAISGEKVGNPFREKKISRVFGVAITPDGRYVVSVSGFFNRVRVWDLRTGDVVRKLEGHSENVACVAVTPDGGHVVTGSLDKTARVWDLKAMDGSHFVLKGHSGTVERVFVSDDGKRIISLDRDSHAPNICNIYVWDKEAKSIMKKTRTENASRFSRKQVLSLVGEGTVDDEADLSILQRGSEIVHGEGSEAHVLGTLETAIRDWDISPDKKTICVGLWDGRVGFLKVQL